MTPDFIGTVEALLILRSWMKMTTTIFDNSQGCDLCQGKNSKDGRDHHHPRDYCRDHHHFKGFLGSDHPRALGFRRVLLLLGGESLFCLPPYTEPTHYYTTTTLQTDAIKCISARCNWTSFQVLHCVSQKETQRVTQREFAHSENLRRHLHIVGHAGGKKYTIPSNPGPFKKHSQRRRVKRHNCPLVICGDHDWPWIYE